MQKNFIKKYPEGYVLIWCPRLDSALLRKASRRRRLKKAKVYFCFLLALLGGSNLWFSSSLLNITEIK